MIIHIPNTFLSFEFFWGLLCKDYKIDQAEQPLGTAIGLHGLEKWLPYFRYFVHRLTIIPVTIVTTSYHYHNDKAIEIKRILILAIPKSTVLQNFFGVRISFFVLLMFGCFIYHGSAGKVSKH